MTEGPRILVATVPKAGTHLIDSILRSMPPLKRKERLALNANLRWHPRTLLPFARRGTCLAGIGRPQRVAVAAMDHSLGRIPPWGYGLAHVPYQPVVMDLVEKRGLIPFALLRDPRDVLVSSMHHIVSKPRHFLHAELNRIGDERQRLLALIDGMHNAKGEELLGVAAQWDHMIGWARDPHVTTLRFEELIGERGGGDPDVQADKILEIAGRIGLQVDRSEAQRIGREMFGTGKTFRKGQIGGWRENLEPDVLAHFNEAFGDRLEKLGYAAV